SVAEIGWPGLSWAKRYIDENTVGSTPKKAAEILKTGDVVYIQQTNEGIWLLAQAPTVAGALVSLRANDGAILALTGGFDFYASKFNRVIQAERQPGSNLKPFIYSAALEKGFTAATTISGAPIAIEDSTLEDVWRPENYSGKFFGPTRLRKALMQSLNLVSIRILRAITPTYAVDYLSRFGFDPDTLPKNLSLALGSASVTPMTMASAFSVFANGGFRTEPYFITRIEDGEGTILEQANPRIVCQTCPETQLTEAEKQVRTKTNPGMQPATTVVKTTDPKAEDSSGNNPGEGEGPVVVTPRWAPRVITPENAFIMTSIMLDVVKHGTGRRALVLEREDLAGKTGTTNEFKDAWFSGFNGDIVTTAWIGFDQPASLGRGEAGASAALPIWIDYMRVALQGMPEHTLAQPENVVQRFIHEETGEPAMEGEFDAIPEFFAINQNADAPDTSIPGENTIPEPGQQPGEVTQPAPDKLPEGLF
ncbi:MAG: penicillin-binding transpeptidase domain-containing protein, partial [Gammaproteobacteria bacterium]|nr:penicillin-binding transpeptidase domain-containing protein [Gammaproteobacteria bacterium]